MRCALAKLPRLCVLLVFSLVVAGCSETGPLAVLDDYSESLERVLAQSAVEVTPRVAPRFPSVRDLREHYPSDSIDLLDFLRLDDCELQQWVAWRNSSLGKFAGRSQRLIYELHFLTAAQACILVIAGQYPELAEQLSSVLAQKQALLPGVIWQAIFGGDEYRHYWQAGNDPLPLAFAADGEVLLALNQLLRDVDGWLEGRYAVDADRLETHLESFRHGDAGLQLLAWVALSNRLDVATGILNHRRETRPLCFGGMKTPKADIFNNVVRHTFVQQIQPWVAGLNSHYYAVFPLIRELEERLKAGEPAAYRQWRRQRDEILVWSVAATVRHVAALQPLLEQCSLLPGREADPETNG